MGNGDAKWWTGDSIEDAQPDAVYLEDDFIRLLIDLKDDYVAMPDGSGNKEGHFLSTFTYEKESSVGNVDYYVFEPVWEKERYFVEFIYNNEGLGITTEFNGAPTSSWPTIAFGGGDFDSYFEVWSLPGGGTKEFVMGRQIGDLTPGVGSEFDFDSDNDGVDDATYLRLIPVVNEVAYCVEINGRLFDLVDGQLTLASNLASYGFNESSYYGKAVWLTADNDDGKHDCNFGSVITKNMLSMFWDEGEHEVQVEFDLSSRLLTYRITYSGAVGSSITSYKVGDSPIALASDIRNRGWKFEGWRYGNKTITKISRDELGLTDVAYDMNMTEKSITIVAKLTRTSYDWNTMGNLTVTGEVSYVDSYSAGINIFGTLRIAASVKEVTLDFKGSIWNYSTIVVEDRGDKDLIINFGTGTVIGSYDQVALDASEVTGKLELYSWGEITLNAGDARVAESEPAVLCGGDVTMAGETFVIQGGNQVELAYPYSPASEGIVGGSGSSVMEITAKSVSVYGGDGLNGADGDDGADGTDVGEAGGNGYLGIDGGDGASAIIYNGRIKVAQGSSLYCSGGNGGKGGDGGNGGNGGRGEDGEWFGATTIPSGDAGNGGNGGYGGDAGNGIEAKMIEGSYTAIAGTPGAAGIGGIEGKPGNPPGHTVLGNEKFGEEGTKGSDGKQGAVGSKFVLI